MLFNDGQQFGLVYYNGQPVSSLYRGGHCIYPYDDRTGPAYLYSGYLFSRLPGTELSYISRILRTDILPNGIEYIYDISSSASKYPIWCWRSSTSQQGLVTLYIYTIGKEIHSSATLCFQTNYTEHVSDISAVAYWDTSETTSLYNCLRGYTGLADISPLIAWNTSNVTNMSYAFYNSGVTSLSPLQFWNTGKVTNMAYMFASCSSLISTSGINNWDMSKVTSVNCMFYQSSIQEVSNLHWDISSMSGGIKTTNSLYRIFAECTSLRVIKNLYWDNMNLDGRGWCEGCTSLELVDLSMCNPVNEEGYNVGESTFHTCSSLVKCDLGTVFTASAHMGSPKQGPFHNCTNLSILILRNTHKVFARVSDLIDGLDNIANNNGTIYVPQSLLNSYLADPGWQALVNAGATILPLEGSQYEQPGSLSL